MPTQIAHRFYTHIPLIIVLGSLILGVIGPYGQDERFPLFERLGLWLIYFLMAMPVLILSNSMLAPLWARVEGLFKVFLLILISGGLAWPLLLMVELLGYVQGRPFPAGIMGLLGAWLEVVTVAFPTLFLIHVLQPSAQGERSADRRKKEPTLVSILGHEQATQIYALKAEGHYTVVFGPAGSHFIDRPFSQLLKLTGDLEGAQVHRSWWVRKAAVIKTRKNGSAYEISLPNGILAPLARRRAGQLRALGWRL